MDTRLCGNMQSMNGGHVGGHVGLRNLIINCHAIHQHYPLLSLYCIFNKYERNKGRIVCGRV